VTGGFFVLAVVALSCAKGKNWLPYFFAKHLKETRTSMGIRNNTRSKYGTFQKYRTYDYEAQEINRYRTRYLL
jgi:hypothetical protein